MKPTGLNEGATLLDASMYEAARQARDPRYDGRFFVGVITTGIYCRPVCPVRVPKQENVRLYRSAASAAKAGFRPCLRCRPESSPGTPAWSGGEWKVAQALTLIEAGFLDDKPLAELADSLGVGGRQLGRLFQQHLGAAPSDVAQTRRLHFAKKLIDETALPLTEVCFAAGFGSVRRFNSVLKQTYGCSPSELRKRGRGIRSQSGLSALAAAPITLQLSYRPPYDWQALLAFLAYRAIPGVESVGENYYARSFKLLAEHASGCAEGHFIACFDNQAPSVELRVWINNTAVLHRVVERVKAILDLRADSAAIENALVPSPQLAGLCSRFPGTRVPGCWSGFEVTVRAILGQQVSVKAASTLAARVAARFGESYNSGMPEITFLFPEPAALIDESLDGLGIVQTRIAAIKEVASRLAEGRLNFHQTTQLDEFIAQLCEVKGIGEWTANYVAMRALGDPDAFPHSDLILLRAAAEQGETLTPKQLLQRSEAWRPWRAYAVLLLWRGYAQEIDSQKSN